MKDHTITVQLVDEQDTPLGTMEKMEAHRLPALHRAVSVLVFNSAGEWLLHQRANDKYHSAGLWTNACCTHPYPGEEHADAARRRLKEEMGLEANGGLTAIFDFVYRAKVNEELTEYEYDRVYTLISDEQPRPDPEEVMEFQYIGREELIEDMERHPERYTAWFKIIFDKFNKFER
jgi:isopentenyl-diphosphate delta-isomerase